MATLTLRRSADRGYADHGWLQSYHTFSFASYFDPKHASHGPLRVINEDQVAPGEGFGKHSHREFEIFSYIVDGELEHRDSLGSLETMRRGQIQMTSVGTGVSHSEFNRNTKDKVNFLQMWAKPHTAGLKPQYYTRNFTDEDKKNRLVKIVAPIGSEGVEDRREGSGPTPIHSNLTVHASILDSSSSLSHAFNKDTVKAYIHLIMKTGHRTPSTQPDGNASVLKVSVGSDELELQEGSGIYVDHLKGAEDIVIESCGGIPAEFLLFEMSSDQ